MCGIIARIHAQSLTHTTICVSAGDKAKILDNISKYSWASSLKSQLGAWVDSKKNSHKSDPFSLLNDIPQLGGKDRNGHNAMLTLGAESAILYYLSGNTDYVQLSADMLSHYTERLAIQDTSEINFYGNHWLGSRNLFPKMPIIYELEKIATTLVLYLFC